MIAYIITGEEERDVWGTYNIPRDVTHVSVDESVTVIPAKIFEKHPNIVELICHDGVEIIERHACYECPRLRRVIMRGVKVVEGGAFWECEELEYVECPKLEKIGASAFRYCYSLSSIDLSSAKEVDVFVFDGCEALVEAKFGEELEYVEWGTFFQCISLERITVPLKNGLFTKANDDVFQGCINLKRAELVEAAVLHDTVAALLLDKWRNVMTAEIDVIHHLLPNAHAGEYPHYEDDDDDDEDDYDIGEKAWEIRVWIRRVLRKIINYKAKHRHLLDEASFTLQLALPEDVVTNNVVPFLELPLHTFDGEDGDDRGEYTSEDEDGEQDNDEDHSHDQLQDDSIPVRDDRDDEAQHQQDNEGGRKRRKTTNEDGES